MKSTTAYALLPGQTLAMPVLNHNGVIMLGAGTRLTEKYIERLLKLNITEVYVEEDASAAEIAAANRPGLAITPAIPYEQLAHETSWHDSKSVVNEMLSDLKNNSMIRGRLSVPTLGDKFHRIYQSLIGELSRQEFIKESLARMHRKDPSLFEHALNVATLSAIIGFANKYSERQLYELTTAALLYDIGMLGLPRGILTKKGKLTLIEKKRIEQHTIEGYQILINHSDIPNSAAICALQHHERYDGSGYPYRSKHPDIHEFAEIVSIADIYDALVSERYHRHSYARGNAVEFLLGSGDRLFNLSLVKLFVSHISIYPIGSKVMLNSGQIAVITSVDSSFVQRPVVRIIRESDGSRVTSPYDIDLKVQLELVIVNTIV
ncbi:HD domain-containing phosphohydrolase [Paenibacillus sp. LHD-117]|uniref:HD-GYP domain-containing protein n=1 Tax=Paenibacillus sp. LHD-117 TaxID=3071412 RepID=UPI0027DFDE8B|nr:HD domain-containing phosphohydrolase [Paenibacillus sp. LHD-117]MDQ6419323.1 HD domain-containing phosphohydrolase [Paenibacillus sp. LHD-117]